MFLSPAVTIKKGIEIEKTKVLPSASGDEDVDLENIEEPADVLVDCKQEATKLHDQLFQKLQKHWESLSEHAE